MQNKGPLVSILMTSYNREKYIGEAIESALNSTYQNFELIVVDDCSTDATVRIAKEYATKDPRVAVYVNEANLGDYPNRNKAASLAKGKYLKYLDADDYIYRHGLEIMVFSMEKFPGAAIGLCKDTNSYELYPATISPNKAYQHHFIQNKPFFTNSPLSAIIRTDKFIEVGGFSGKRHVGDYELWLKLGAKYEVVKMLQGLAFWRKHDEQENAISRKSFKRPYLNYQVEVLALNDDSCPLTNKEKDRALRNLKNRYSRYILKNLISKNFSDAYKLKKNLNLTLLDLASSLRMPKIFN